MKENRLYELLKTIGDEKGFTVVDCKAGESDHVHDLRKYLWKGQLWNGSYYKSLCSGQD